MANITEMPIGEKMTLRQALEKVEKTNSFISVGADNGSGWFYIGDASEAVAYMNAESEIWKMQITKYISTLKDRVLRADDTIALNKPRVSYAEAKLNNGGALTDEERRTYALARERLLGAELQITRYKKRISKLNKQLLHWTPFLDRHVTRIYYQTVLAPHSINILFEGEEMGGIWTEEEFVTRRKNKQERRRLI